MAKVPNIKLNNNLTIPALGLGTVQATSDPVKDAIDIGYRHFDCAHAYKNESLIGEAIKEKIRQGMVKREDLFITSKLWCNSHRSELVEAALRTTLKNLQLDYLDLYLVHWPFSFKESEDKKPMDPKTGIPMFNDGNIDYLDTWKAMEAVQRKGLTKSIGVSNFNSQQIERLLKSATIKPVINQVECHAYLKQHKLRTFCRERGIVLTSYSPLGSPGRRWHKAGDPEVIDDQKIKEIAERYGKTPAQILLRYNVQLGNSVIPRSSNKERLKQNINIFDFELTSDDFKLLETLDCNGRLCAFPEASKLRYYPFTPDVEF